MVAVWGILSGGKQKSVKDYFLGASKVPWYVVSFSIVAAETSALTFISIPGLAYLTNLNFLQVTIGYLLGRIVIAKFLLPEYFKGDLSTAYMFLEGRFGTTTRRFASVVFIITRVASDGVRLFATAIPLKILLDIEYPYAIIIVAAVALIYTFTGGLKSVIWVDAIQMFVYLGGAIVSGIFIFNALPGGFSEVLQFGAGVGKFEVFNFGFEGGIAAFFSKPYTLIAGLLGGAFLSMASHGVDQTIVQRLMATEKLKSAQRALIGSGVIVIFQFALFLTLGGLLYAYFDGVKFAKSDEIFPTFIIHHLPTGVKGFLIAGLFASATSSISGSLNSLSSSTMMDLIIPILKSIKEEMQLTYSKILTIFWAIILVFSAFFFMSSDRAVVETALSIASFTYGGLLGTFLSGIFNKKLSQRGALVGFSVSIAVMAVVIASKTVAWTWFTLIGVMIAVSIGMVFSQTEKRN